MATYFQALLWAAAIIFVALASQANLIPEDVAIFLVLTLPAVAWGSISRGRSASCSSVEC